MILFPPRFIAKQSPTFHLTLYYFQEGKGLCHFQHDYIYFQRNYRLLCCRSLVHTEFAGHTKKIAKDAVLICVMHVRTSRSVKKKKKIKDNTYSD